jgi:hypothetical protein
MDNRRRAIYASRALRSMFRQRTNGLAGRCSHCRVSRLPTSKQVCDLAFATPWDPWYIRRIVSVLSL